MKKILSIILILTLAFGTVNSLSFGYNGENSTQVANTAVSTITQASITSSNTVTGGATTITGAYVTISCAAASVTMESEQDIDVDIVLSNVNDIYAEDFVISYNPEVLEYQYYTLTSNSPSQVYYADAQNNKGLIRFIMASKDKYSAVNGEANIIRLKFRVKYVNGGTWMNVYGKVANSQGHEGDITCSGKYFSTRAKIQDVNGTGTFTIGDLAIAASFKGNCPPMMSPFRPDVDRNFIVDDNDLRLIVNELLNS